MKFKKSFTTQKGSTVDLIVNCSTEKTTDDDKMKNLFSKRTRIFARETKGKADITVTGRTIDLIALLAIINSYFAKRVATEKGISVENAKEFIYSCVEDFDKHAIS